MKLIINQIDYTPVLDAAQPVEMERAFGTRSICRLLLSLPDDNRLAVPSRLQTLEIAADDGTVWFAGTIATKPMPQYAGASMEGPRYRLQVEALGDARDDAQSDFIPSRVHILKEGDGLLNAGKLAINSDSIRTLANDITICGEHEPTAYVSEFFLGDGTTTQFYLSEKPFFPPSSESTIADDAFNQPGIDARVWDGTTDVHFSLGGGGLSFNGGAGIDGQTLLTFRTPVEMGGTLLLEAKGIALARASTGILGGLFSGEKTADGCVAGFQAIAEQGMGAVSLQSLLCGAPVGLPYALDTSKLYTLRIRVHCPEHQRVLATYRAYCDGKVIAAGGQTVPAAGFVQFEIQDCVNGVLGMPVTLYEGAIESLPATCQLIAASSINLNGQMRGLCLTSLGSAWVNSAPSGGSMRARRLGAIEQSAECEVQRSGKLVFFTGFAPAVGELIEVRYRASRRAVSRAVDATATRNERWIGSVTNPGTRSSTDCRNAAAILLQAGASQSARWSGTLRTTQYELGEDVKPGEALAIDAPSCGVHAQLMVRGVHMIVHQSLSDLVEYTITFANNWAQDRTIKTDDTVPDDAWLPAPIPPEYLANLPHVTAIVNGNSVSLNMGITAPQGGGFEVRRRDGVFAPGVDADLMLRGQEQNFVVARAAASERYYVRMFDGSTPPKYSEFSAAVIVNVPLG